MIKFIIPKSFCGLLLHCLSITINDLEGKVPLCYGEDFFLFSCTIVFVITNQLWDEVPLCYGEDLIFVFMYHSDCSKVIMNN